MNITPRQLRAFTAVYRLGSITRAAERMRLTQSAVSVLIRGLEQTLNVVLFERTTRSLRPTQVADDTVQDAERLLNDLDKLNAKFRGVAERSRGNVTLALSAGIGASLGGVMFKRFRERFPGAAVHLHDVAPGHVVSLVLDEEVEFGIGARDIGSKEIRQKVIASDTVCAICLQSDSIAHRESITWDEIADFTTIATPRSDSLRKVIDLTLARAKRSFEATYEVSFLDTALSMTAQGLGISIMPSHLIPHLHRPMLVAVPLLQPAVRRQLCLITKVGKRLSPAAADFASIAKEVFDEQTSAATLLQRRGRSKTSGH